MMKTNNPVYILITAYVALLASFTPMRIEASTFNGSVKESLKHLLENNRDFKKVQADWQRAKMNVREAASAAFPTMNYSGNYTYLGNIQSFEFDVDGSGGEDPLTLKAASEDNYTQTLSLEQTLFSGSVLGAIKVARSYRAAANNQLIAQRNMLIRDYLTSYAQTIMLADIKKVNEEMVEYTASHYEEAKLLHEMGAVDNYTLLRAEVDHLNSIPALKESEKLFHASISNLKLMLDLNDEDELKLAEFDVEINLSNDRLKLISYAREHRSEVKAASHTTRAYTQALGIYRSARFPSLSGFGNYSRQNQWDLFSQENVWNNAWAVGLNLDIPLFSGFRTSAQVQKGKIDVAKARYDESILTDMIQIEVELAIDDYQRSNSDFDAWFRNVELAREGFEIVQLRWSNGDGSELELRDARIALQSAQANLSRAKFDLLRTKILLVYALGDIDDIVIIENENSGQ